MQVVPVSRDLRSMTYDRGQGNWRFLKGLNSHHNLYKLTPTRGNLHKKLLNYAMVTKMMGTFLKPTIGHYSHDRSYQNDYDLEFFFFRIKLKEPNFKIFQPKKRKNKTYVLPLFSLYKVVPPAFRKGGSDYPLIFPLFQHIISVTFYLFRSSTRFTTVAHTLINRNE